MALLRYAENGTPWFNITFRELIEYSGNAYPICDDCITSLIGCNDIVLIPILNEAYCPKCGKDKLSAIRRYAADAPAEKRRMQYYLDYFGRKRGVDGYEGMP